VNDLLPICHQCGIPLVFDYHHYCCYHKIDPESENVYQELMGKILDTWKIRDVRPKFHLSSQDHNKNIGAHNDYITYFPRCLQNMDIDIMIEAKCKDLAVLKCIQSFVS